MNEDKKKYLIDLLHEATEKVKTYSLEEEDRTLDVSPLIRGTRTMWIKVDNDLALRVIWENRSAKSVGSSIVPGGLYLTGTSYELIDEEGTRISLDDPGILEFDIRLD